MADNGFLAIAPPVATKVWLRHLHYTHNISGEPPPVVVKNKKKVVAIDESQKE